MLERWIRKLAPEYRSKRELRNALKWYEKAKVCHIVVKTKFDNRDLYEWRRQNRCIDKIEEEMLLLMMPRLRRHLQIVCTESAEENCTYFTASIDVADKWEGRVTYEQGNSDRKPDARS